MCQCNLKAFVLFSTHSGVLNVLDVLPHLLHLTLQLLRRLHNLRLEFSDVFFEVGDVHLHLGLSHMHPYSNNTVLISENPQPFLSEDI